MGWIKESIKRNHFAQMAVCCLLPLVFIVALLAFGINNPAIYIIAGIICIGSHILMMHGNLKEGKSCH